MVDAQWADNGPGWVALLLTDAETVLALHPKAVDSGRFSAVGVIGPYPPHSEVDFEVRALSRKRGGVKTRHGQPQRRTRSMADR